MQHCVTTASQGADLEGNSRYSSYVYVIMIPKKF
jgi:hypothetical protein